MKTVISNTSAQDAGVYIQEKLSLNKEKKILFIVSGGSSLTVLSHIDQTVLGDHMTVILTDERFTEDQTGINFIQLQKTDFYTHALEKQVHFISSKPQSGESHSEFAQRLDTTLQNYLNENTNVYVIGIFGIGEDGHTASIFPTSEVAFDTTFKADALYTAVTQEVTAYPQRVTITPSCIQETLDEVVLYAVGSVKCDNILNYIHNKNFTHFQIPALIPAQHPQSILFTDCPTLI